MPTSTPTLSATADAARGQPLTVQAIQQRLGATLSGDGQAVISGVNALELAQAGEITFAESPRHLPAVRDSRASAIVVPPDFPAVHGRTLLRVAQPRVAFVAVMHLFQPSAHAVGGVHRKAVVASDVTLGEDVTIRECAVVRSRARIGARTVIESGAHIGEGVVIGEDGYVGPNVVIMSDAHVGNRVIIHGGTVIGADGFGFVWHEGRHVKIPQVGRVIIEDDVELGANVCVDRATMGATIIKRGTKIDNLVQIAHNDLIGEDVILTGQVGLSGSVTVGNRVMFGGQSGAVDHVTIGDDARIGAATPVTKDVKAGETVWGFPARPSRRVKRELAALVQLPKLLPRLRDLARQLRAIESRLGALEQRQ